MENCHIHHQWLFSHLNLCMTMTVSLIQAHMCDQGFPFCISTLSPSLSLSLNVLLLILIIELSGIIWHHKLQNKLCGF
jgi:hypothetical protein